MRPAVPDVSFPPAAPPAPRRRRRPWFLVALLLVLAGFVAYLSPAGPALAQYGAWPTAPDRTRTFIVAGTTPKYVAYHTAAPEDFGGLTDTILLVQLRAGQREVRLLSIPRDTWTAVPDWGMAKINSANVHGGPEALVKAAQDLTGVPIEGYVLLSLNALREVTDALGGVVVDVEKPMQYTDTAAKLYIDLKPGRQLLSGSQAEAFMRFRKDNLGDIGRVGRQQQFFGAVRNRLVSPAGVLHAPEVVGALARNVRTDLSREQVGTVLGALLRVPAVKTDLLPGDFGGSGTWQPDRDAIRELVREKFAPEVRPGDPRAMSVTVVNVSAPDGSARRLKAKLESLGYTNVRTANGSGAADRTVVVAKNLQAAERLRGDLGYGAVSDGEGEPGADLTVRLGADTPTP